MWKESQWIMKQSWENLWFLHYSVEPSAIRSLLPEPLELDTCEERAWVSLVCFETTKVSVRGMSRFTLVPKFHQLNFRTYAKYKGLKGVYFFSLDVDSPLTAFGANTFFGLPYFTASMELKDNGDDFYFQSARKKNTERVLSVRFKNNNDLFVPQKGSLADWLANRFILFKDASDGAIWGGKVSHPLWPLQTSVASLRENTVFKSRNLSVPEQEPLVHYCRAMRDIIIYPLKKMD